MADFTDPNNWTEEYVRSHRRECLSHLKEDNLLVIRYVQQNNYTAAIAGLDRILNGLMTMQNSNCGDYWSMMSMFSMAEGVLLTLLGPKGVSNAIEVLKDAKDFAKKPETKREVDAILAPLQAGESLDAQPDDVVWLLQKMNPKLDAAISSSGTSPGRSVSSPDRSVSAPVSSPVDGEFEIWVKDNGWDEEDLERYYKKIRFRRNLYGLCLLFGPLGILILPFWLRAVHITKSIRQRTFSVKFSFLTWVVYLLFGLPTLFIYPLIMGKIITATNWGMGMGGRRAWIPIIVTIVLVVGIVLVPKVIQTLDSAPSTTESPAETSEPPQTEPGNQTEPGDRAALSAEEFEQVLIGSWAYANREGYGIITNNYDFLEEGKFYFKAYQYSNVHGSNDMVKIGELGEDEYGWYNGTGALTLSGNYSLTASGDDRFTLAVFYDPNGPLEQSTYELTYIDDDTILIDGRTFVRGSDYTLAELARIFGFDIEVEDAAGNP